MSAYPEPAPPAPMVERCPLCGAAVGANDARCPECNMTLAGVGTRAPAFSRQSLWYFAAAWLAIYLVVLAIVAAAR
jgi:hypothetical protein